MAKIKTVKIVANNSRGFKVINECDFDKNKHKLVTGAIEKEAKAFETKITKIEEDADKKKETVRQSFLSKVVTQHDPDC